MIKQSECDEARDLAASSIRKTGLVISDEEAAGIEVADFGLSRLKTEGAQILILASTERIEIKILTLFPGQTIPEHRHPRVKEDPGKEETLRVVSGRLYLFLEGEEPGRPSRVPKGRAEVYTCNNEIRLGPGDQYTMTPGTWHWFQGGKEGCVLFSFSSVSYDELDQFRDPDVRRCTRILKD